MTANNKTLTPKVSLSLINNFQEEREKFQGFKKLKRKYQVK